MISRAILPVKRIRSRGFFVVEMLYGFADGDAAAAELEIVFGAHVGGEPKFSVNLLAIDGEGGSDVERLAGIAARRDRVGAHDPAAGFYDGEILIIDPHASLK